MLTDSHCHLDLAAFDNDLEQVIAASRQAGVTRFLIPGTTPAGWARQQQIAARFSDIDLAFGLHPYFYDTLNTAGLTALESHFATSGEQAVAVGEIGLDATVDIAAEQQEKLFVAQLSLATNLHLPVILHHRKTHHRLLGLIRQTGFTGGGIVHAFSGSLQDARKYVDAGFLLGVGGTITYPRARKTRDTIAAMPLTSLVLETDAPDMPVNGRQGQRNSPQYLIDIASTLAHLKALPVAEVIRQTTDNYLRLFNLGDLTSVLTKSDNDGL